MTTFNIYCDESCHLEHDASKVMVVGAVWCPEEKVHEIARRIRDLKQEHAIARWQEIKWTKVSPSRAQFYERLVDYFFDDDDLHFRGVVIPDKSLLRHEDFAGQDHDTFYYKMYYRLIRNILTPDDRYNIYLDIKDTRSRAKEVKLHDVLCNSLYDRDRQIILKLQSVRSYEVEQIQLADVLTGALAYASRALTSSRSKLAIVDRIRNRSGYPLTRSTLVRATKFNLFFWQAQ